MICKNCGKEIADNSRFCTLCGAKQDEQSAPVQQTAPVQNEAPVVNQEPVQQNTPVQNEVPVQQNVPVTNEAQPQGTAPVENAVPTQATVDPAGQPTGVPYQPTAPVAKKFDFKKYLPMLIAIAGGVVAVIIVVFVVVNIVSNSGVKGVVNRMEDAINDKDIDKYKELYPDFVAEEMDIDGDTMESALGLIDGFDVGVDFEVVDEEDITDEEYEYDDSMTWAEYIQEYYADNYIEYDDEDVDAVSKVTVKMEMDFDSGIANAIAGALTDSAEEQELTCVKVDGDWYIFEN